MCFILLFYFQKFVHNNPFVERKQRNWNSGHARCIKKCRTCCRNHRNTLEGHNLHPLHVRAGKILLLETSNTCHFPERRICGIRSCRPVSKHYQSAVTTCSWAAGSDTKFCILFLIIFFLWWVFSRTKLYLFVILLQNAIQNCNFTCCFVWVWNLVCHIHVGM